MGQQSQFTEKMSQWLVNIRHSILPEIGRIQLKSEHHSTLYLLDWKKNLKT
jgi:hypothetical protein